MKKLLILSILVCALKVQAAFTDFYVIKGTGTNVNSGSTPDANPTFTADSGNWTNATWTFFKAALNPVTGGVTNGAWASICTNLTATNAWLVGLVTNASDTTDTIQLSQVAFMGVNPADRIGDCVVRVGGAWAGPNTNTMANGGGFPFAFFAVTATNTPNATPCCNIKGGTTYGISNAITHALNGPSRFQGYTNTVRDGGRAIIDGNNAASSSIILLTLSGNDNDLVDLTFSNNGQSGSAASLVTVSGARNNVIRCVFTRARRSGLVSSGSTTMMVECEAYDCNLSGTASQGGFNTTGVPTFVRCISHDNAGSGSSGFFLGGTPIHLINCIADSNASHGFNGGGATLLAINCDSYNNGGSGLVIGSGTVQNFTVQNCNLVNNTSFGIDVNSSILKNGQIVNCAFGTGTQTNDSGNFSASTAEDIGTLLYAADVTPWADPANGNFSINLTTAKAVGRGSFTETQSSYSGTVGYPDIGAAQSASTNATTRATSFSQ